MNEQIIQCQRLLRRKGTEQIKSVATECTSDNNAVDIIHVTSNVGCTDQ